MDNTKIFFASDARKLTEESDFLIRNCYKWIKEAAARNCNQIILDKYDYDDSMIDNTIFQLKNAGYKVKESIEENVYYINW